MTETTADAAALPDGLSEEHARPSVTKSWAGSLAPLLLGALLAIAMAGQLGGIGHRSEVRAPAAILSIDAPQRLRNGEFFETLVAVTPNADTADLTIVLPAALHRNVTINTMIPAPESESYQDGSFRFGFGPVAAGERLLFKIDGQVNPTRQGVSHGRIVAMDGDVPLASLPVRLEVLP